jgi:type III secretion protein R
MFDFSPSSAIVIIVAVSLAPFVAVMVTSFTKIVVVLTLLRNALGLQQVPPNIVLNGLALILSVYVMYPVGLKMSEQIDTIPSGPLKANDVSRLIAMADVAKEPLREFLIRHSINAERNFFLNTLRSTLPPESREKISDTDFIVVIPAFVVSELSVAFQIGFLIFLPFLIVDLVVSNVLQAMGVQMLSPTTVSLPFKLLLFVMVNGWVQLTHGLVLSYH